MSTTLPSSLRQPAGLVTNLLSRLEGAHLAAVPDNPAGFRLGFDPLDRVLGGGLRLHDLVLLGGRPGVGKTIATLQWARNLAAAGQPVVYACYEHDERTLIARLIALELGNIGAMTPRPEMREELHGVVSEVMAGRWTMASTAGRHPMVRAARAAIDAYADRLVLLAASPTATDPQALAGTVSELTDEAAVLFVDYLQKVPAGVSHATSSGDRLAAVATQLKELTLNRELTIVAIAAAEQTGLVARRLRLHHLESAHVLGYEADVIVLLNEKGLATSKVHLSYDSTQAERFRRFVVFSIEKNRGGPARVDVEFEKDFAFFRFAPRGGFVAERLVDDLVYED